MNPDVNNYGKKCAELLERVRSKHPLIHHLTNYVVMNDTANLTLAFGASPVMAHAKEEVAEMVSMAGALVLNPGTLSADWVDSMLEAGKKANELQVPIIYDPVGVGATHFRNETGKKFLKNLQLSIIRGNSGEMGALAGMGGVVKGVDSVEGVKDPARVCSLLARNNRCVAVITGKRDILSDGQHVIGVDNGNAMLSHITGTGCMATSAIAVFKAVEEDSLLAAGAALAIYGLASEIAAKTASGPGTLRVGLMDAVYNLTPEEVEKGVRIVELETV